MIHDVVCVSACGIVCLMLMLMLLMLVLIEHYVVMVVQVEQTLIGYQRHWMECWLSQRRICDAVDMIWT